MQQAQRDLDATQGCLDTLGRYADNRQALYDKETNELGEEIRHNLEEAAKNTAELQALLERESQRAAQIMELEIRQSNILRQKSADMAALGERRSKLEHIQDSVHQVLQFHEDGTQLHSHLQMFLNTWFDHLRAAMETKIKTLDERQLEVKNKYVENFRALHNQLTQDLLRNEQLQKLYAERMEMLSETLARASELEDPDLFAESQGALEEKRAKLEEITRLRERLEKELTELERKDKERFKVVQIGWYEQKEREAQKQRDRRSRPRFGTSERGENSDDEVYVKDQPI